MRSRRCRCALRSVRRLRSAVLSLLLAFVFVLVVVLLVEAPGWRVDVDVGSIVASLQPLLTVYDMIRCVLYMFVWLQWLCDAVE